MFRIKAMRFFITVILVLSVSVFSQTIKWEQVGLSGGHVVYLAIDPSNSNTVYAGSWNGIYKSTNAGSSWYAKNSGLPSKSVESIAVNPSNSSIVYIGLWDGGLYRSSDGGSTWYKRTSGMSDTYVMALAINPQSTSTIYAGTVVGSGMFKSTNSASSWTIQNSGLSHMGVVTIALKPNSPSTIFVGTEGGGVFRSLTSGMYWYSKNSGLGNTNVQALVIDPSNNSTIYAATHGGVYKSTDSGSSWSAKNSGITNYELKAIAISESDPEVLYVGSWGGGIFKTTNGGSSWTQINSGLGNYTVVSLAVNPADPNTVYAGTWGSGIYKTKNTAPGTPTLASPPDGYYTNDTTPVLTWYVPDDDDSDPLHFKVEIDATNIWSYVDYTIESKSSTTGFSPTPPVSEGTGQISYTAQYSLSDGDWWWRVSAWDGSQYGAVSTVRKISIDTIDPYTTGHIPSKYAVDVPSNSTLSFHVKDSFSGVQSGSITLKINGQIKTSTITGSSSDYTVSYTPSGGFPYEQTLTVAIDASDQAGNVMYTDSYTLTIQEAPDQEPPGIVHNAKTTAVKGASVAIDADVTDNKVISYVRLYYRMGGSQSYLLSNMIWTDGNTYQATIASNYATERGLEYYILASDGVGNQTTTPSFNPASSPHVIQCTYSSLACPTALPEKTYRMVSVPGDLNFKSPDSVLIDDFGKHRRSDWRLIRDDGNNYLEHDKQNLFFEPGCGFWVISNEAGSWDVGSGRSVSTAQNYTIFLKPGWTQIGNPFAFPVSWSDVILNGNVEGLVAYEGDGNDTAGYLYNQTTLQPWQGYYVHNLESYTVSAQIPPMSSDGPFQKILIDLKDPSDWIIQIKAKCGKVVDSQNYAGCLTDAETDWDRNDFSEAPPFSEYISLSFPHQEWSRYPGNYTGDFRPHSSQGHIWDMQLQTNLRNAIIEMTVEQLSLIPEDFEIVIKNLESGTQKLLTDRSESYILSGSVNKLSLQLIVGTKSFHTQYALENEVPENCRLLQNYPNPFNASTAISYQLTKSSNTILEIKNVLGQKVRTLVNAHQQKGHYSVQWNSENDEGIAVPTGTYIISLKSGGYQKSKKIVLLR